MKLLYNILVLLNTDDICVRIALGFEGKEDKREDQKEKHDFSHIHPLYPL